MFVRLDLVGFEQCLLKLDSIAVLWEVLPDAPVGVVWSWLIGRSVLLRGAGSEGQSASETVERPSGGGSGDQLQRAGGKRIRLDPVLPGTTS